MINVNTKQCYSCSSGQAKEVVSKFEEKLQFLKVDLMFLEKIQKVLTNTQVQIKSEVLFIHFVGSYEFSTTSISLNKICLQAMKSITHEKMINTMMTELKDRLNTYTERSLDNKVNPV